MTPDSSKAKNVAIEYGWASNRVDQLLAADLVRRQVAAIVGAGGVAAQVSRRQPRRRRSYSSLEPINETKPGGNHACTTKKARYCDLPPCGGRSHRMPEFCTGTDPVWPTDYHRI